MEHCAVEFVVVELDGRRLDPSLSAALRDQVDKGVIRIIDLLFVQKNAEGAVRSFELDEVPDGPQMAGVPQVIDGLISPEDVSDIGDGLQPGATALIVLFEHTWLHELRRAVESSGGRVVFTERIPGRVVAAVAEAAKALL